VPAPTFGSPLRSVYNTTADPKTAGPFTLAVGDFLVVLVVFENNPATLAPAVTTTGTAALTFTKAQEVTTLNTCRVVVWYSQTVTVAGSYTVSVSEPSLEHPGLRRGRVADHVVGRGRHVQSGDRRCGDDPVADVVGREGELRDLHDRRRLRGGAIATRAYLTADAGAFTEQTAQNTGTNYSTYSGVYPDAGAAGTKVVGMSAPTRRGRSRRSRFWGRPGRLPGRRCCRCSFRAGCSARRR
jgi:hypothetical protein